MPKFTFAILTLAILSFPRGCLSILRILREISQFISSAMAKIVIIDDEPNIVELVVTACRELGHDTFPFVNSSKALDQLAVIAPQLVISDIKMDKVDGFEVLRRVHGALDNCHVILM